MNKNELDKIAARALPPLPEDEIIAMVDPIVEMFPKVEYLMLLSKELSYYTIFKIHPLTGIRYAIEKIFDFIKTDDYLVGDLGQIKHIETNEQYVEIWIDEYHFALFECSNFIVNI